MQHEPTTKKLGLPSVRTNLGLSHCYKAWEEELADDKDRDFLLNGIRHGFDIVDSTAAPIPVDTPNNRSAQPDAPLYEQATKQVLKEIEQGNYVVCQEKPKVISPFSAIPKPDGGVRLIHNGSQPPGASMNDYATLDMHHLFQTIDDAAKLMAPEWFLAKVDLKSAYRSVPISEHSQQFTGLKWMVAEQTVYLRDTKLPFGSKLAPGIFHQLSQSVKRMMARRGYSCLVAYLDSFLILAPTRAACQEAQTTLIHLLRKLGFQISWNKLIDPTQCLTFLGVELDTVSMCLRLSRDKLAHLHQELLEFAKRQRATKRQLQSLTGKLNWAAAVIYGGRVFLRRIIDLSNSLKCKTDRVRLSHAMRRDLQWWLQFMAVFNGKSAVLDRQPITTVHVDACNTGCGGTYGSDWFYCNWSLDWAQVEPLHINYKELLSVVVAAIRWAPFWGGKRLYIMSDNQAAVGMLNRGTAKHPLVMEALRWLFWLSATYGFHLSGRYIPGVKNAAADSASRLLEPGQLARLVHCLPVPCYDFIPLGIPTTPHISEQVLAHCCRQ